MAGLPIHAAVVASYLSVMSLAQRPIREIKEAAAAIEYYHRISELFFDSDYIAITLKKAAEYAALNKGDKSKPNGHDAQEGTDDGQESQK